MRALLSVVVPVLLGLLTISGLITLLSDQEESPTDVALANLLSGEIPDEDWLSISGGEVDIEHAISYGKDMGDGEIEASRHFLPLSLPGGARSPIVVVVSDEQMQVMQERGTPAQFTGTIDRTFGLPSLVEKHYAKIGFDIDQIQVLEFGSKPPTKSEGAGMFAFGFLGLGAFVFLRRRRRASKGRGMVADAVTEAFRQARA